MRSPFENLFGTTLELRMLSFLLPMEGIKFNSAELAEEFGISVEKASKIIRKFEKYDIMMGVPGEDGMFYTINPESDIFRSLENIDNRIIYIEFHKNVTM